MSRKNLRESKSPSIANSVSDYKSPFGLKKQMGYTRQEFMEILPGLLSNYSFEFEGKVVSISLNRGMVLIRVGCEGVRRFTQHVSFPILAVEIEFFGLTDEEENAFLRQFDRHFMKGLG